jgi:hypothetical protein
LLRSKAFRAGRATFQTATPPAFDGFGVFAVIFPILDLAGGDIDDQLAELHRVARAFEALGCHGLNMASSRAFGNPASTGHGDPLQSN